MNRNYLITVDNGIGNKPDLTRLSNVSEEYMYGYYDHIVKTFGENRVQLTEIK